MNEKQNATNSNTMKPVWKENYLVRTCQVVVNGIAWTMLHQRHHKNSELGRQRIDNGTGLDEIIASCLGGDYHFDGFENLSKFLENGIEEESNKIREGLNSQVIQQVLKESNNDDKEMN